MVNVLFNNPDYKILPKQLEVFDKYCKIIQWGRQNPTRFLEDFMNLQFTDTQKWVLLSSWVPQTCVWLASRDSGKSEVLTSKVYTKVKDRGEDKKKPPFKTIGELKVGDLIYDEQGQLTKIIHLNPIIFDEVYEVEFEDGEIIECNGDHLWSVYDKNYIKNHEHKLIVRNTDYLYYHFDDIKRKDGYKEYRFHIPINKPINYPDIQHYPIHPYLLGVWLGDGTSSSSIIASGEQDVKEMTELLRPYVNTINYRLESNKQDCYQIRIDFKKDMEDANIKTYPMIKKLKEMDLYNNKHIPYSYLYGPIWARLALLQGLMDTDGTISEEKGKGTNHCEFTQSNEALARQVLQLIESLGMQATLSHKEHTNYIKQDGTEADTWRIYFMASKDMPVFKLKRKYDRLPNHLSNRVQQKGIKSIRKTGEKKAMRCITVDNESGLYLTGDHYTVTHNSFMSAPFIMARTLLIPSHNTYIMAPSGGQAQETFTKLENLAKDNIASIIGVSSVFLDECVRVNSKADCFVHDKNSYHVETFNGSTINTLNSVAKNIVGIRSNLNFRIFYI